VKNIDKTLKLYLHPTDYEYGFADLRGLLQDRYAIYSYGISILRRLDPRIIDGISDGPTREYFDHYHAINRELNDVVMQISKSLSDAGIPCEGVCATVQEHELCTKTLTYPVSHKLVATRAGLGWIGKTDLLVSKRFGPRIRLASILTTHRLEVSTHIDESQCVNCAVCVAQCPAKAANGTPWNTSTHRDVYFNAFACRDYCRKITMERLNENLSICGKCVSVCPFGSKPRSVR
jgi:epoxyqueuosine reductase QueG